jgi:D-xylono/L-arabinono-1,4-lactonase
LIIPTAMSSTPPRPLRLLAATRCALGEGPLWDERRQTLFWSDIDGGELHAWHRPSEATRRIYQGPPIGGFTLEADGALALFRVNDIARFHPENGQVLDAREFKDPGMRRFNDVRADSRGRIFAGTIGVDATSGGLFRFDPDGTSRLLFRDTGVANGIGFSPDGGTLYWTCSTTGRIFAFAYDEATGSLSRRRVFYHCTPDEGVPDGLCVDREGGVWSARWDGFAVRRHAPADGRVTETITLPVARPTSCCFGSAGDDRLFITTARRPDEAPESLAGGLFAAQLPVHGLDIHPSRLFCG